MTENDVKHIARKGISHHFRREAKLMFGVFLAVIMLGILAAIIVPRMMLHFDSDRCLELGGVFNYEAGHCEMRKNE